MTSSAISPLRGNKAPEAASSAGARAMSSTAIFTWDPRHDRRRDANLAGYTLHFEARRGHARPYLTAHFEFAAVDAEFVDAIGGDTQLRAERQVRARPLSRGRGRRLSRPASVLSSHARQAPARSRAAPVPLQANWPLTRLGRVRAP